MTCRRVKRLESNALLNIKTTQPLLFGLLRNRRTAMLTLEVFRVSTFPARGRVDSGDH